jgi:hypothetical protein
MSFKKPGGGGGGRVESRFIKRESHSHTVKEAQRFTSHLKKSSLTCA